ncbi:MAG: methionyl-tRNA formyltransferase [Puniceicoccales bacterium]|nr:methionyl-tRNA formyltransferase [Puniceicoccales bacterium]
MKPRVIFFGSHWVAISMLEYLKTKGQVELTCIVSQPDRASGRGGHLKPTAISEWATCNSIPLLCPEKLSEEFSHRLCDFGCDLILVMAYGHILREYIINLPPLGIYNFHASLLPWYRGSSPVETAIACGENITGVSLMEIVREMDAGDVLDVEKVQIAETDFSSDVYRKLSQVCVTIIERNIVDIVHGTAKRTKQDSCKATFTRKVAKLDGYLDFNLSPSEIYNRVRGFHEHVGSHVLHSGVPLSVGKILPGGNGIAGEKCGKIVNIDREKITVSAQTGTIFIFELQRPGGKMLKIRDFLNGYRVNIGDHFALCKSEPIVAMNPFCKVVKGPLIQDICI